MAWALGPGLAWTLNSQAELLSPLPQAGDHPLPSVTAGRDVGT